MTTASVEDIRVRLNERLNDSLGESKYRLWFAQARVDCDCDANRVRVTAPSRFVANWIDDHYRSDLRRIAEQELGGSVAIEIDAPQVDPSPQPTVRPSQPEPAAPKPTPEPRRPDARAQRLRYSLDDYVVGPSNRLAHTAALQLAGDGDAFNPLFVHGGCGVGKTHLLQGLCRRYAALHPDKRWRFTTAEQFTNEYINAVRSNALPAFRAQVRRLDLLVVDDVHFFENKNSTQAEFLHTFDSIDLHGAKVALASDSHPKHIRQFSEALVSRCMSGMVVQIDPPDPTTRRLLVEAIAARKGLNLHESVVPLIAERSHGSVREIEGMLTTLKALAALESGDHAESATIGHVLVDRLLGASGTVRPARPIRFASILDAICDEMMVDKSTVLSNDRHRQIVLARSLVVHLARELTTLSFPEIARQLARPNHSTVVTAHQRIARQFKADTTVRLPGRPGPMSLSALAESLHHRIIREAGA